MTKSDKDLIFKVGIAAGVYLLVVQPILKKIGVLKTQADITVENQQTLPNNANPFSPVFYKTGGRGVLLLSVGAAQDMARKLYDAFGFFSDNEAQVFAIFRALKTQSQVSFLSEQFKNLYKQDLLQFLSKGKGVMPQAGLNNTELNQVINIVNNLPKFKV